MIAILSLSCLLLAITDVRAQGLLSGLQGIRGQQSPVDRLPGFGACDRIAARGAANCMENFLPTNVLSGITGGPRGGNNGNICCSYSKYRACITGLHDGLRLAMERERCPKSYSAKIIKSSGDNLVGLPLRNLCDNASTGKSQCPKRSGKPKKNRKPTQNTRNQNRRNQEEVDPIGGLGGLNPLNGGGGGLNPLGGGLNPFGGGLNPLNGGLNPLGGGLNPLGSSLNPVGSGLNPGGLFGGSVGSNRRTDNGQNPDFLGGIRDGLSRGADTFQQGMAGVLNGATSFINGFGNLGGGGANTRNAGAGRGASNF